jgi:hypothetical protein
LPPRPLTPPAPAPVQAPAAVRAAPVLPPRPVPPRAPVAASRPTPAPAPPVAAPTARAARGDQADAALRELTLAWFEARGYRGSPASPAVRPIELVLRHKADPARAYAFVVEPRRVSGDRVEALADQARSIGLLRLLIVADGGVDNSAVARRKGVRLMDRGTMDGELKKLDISVAAKIIAVARKRTATRAAVAH